MSELAWARERLQCDVAPIGSAQNVKTRIRNAARALGWKFSRARTVWYGDDRASIKPKELRRIEEVTGIAYGREERREVDDLIGRADTILAGRHPHFRGSLASALRAFVGALDRSGAGGRGE